jgi:hypothetical protein
MSSNPAQTTRDLDPWRRVAILLIGVSSTLVALGPVYGGACGSYLRAGETGEGLLFCQLVPMLFGAPIVAVAAGVVAGLIGRGILDWILLLAGAAIGGLVGSELLGDGSMGVTVLVVGLINLSIAYGVVRGVRHRRGSATVSPRQGAALALGSLAVVVASGTMAAQLPRKWQPPVRGHGVATVRLDERPGESFSAAVECDWSPGAGRYVGLSGGPLGSSRTRRRATRVAAGGRDLLPGRRRFARPGALPQG